MAKPIVAIVGRPNVGKSTLFNVLANERISIVEDIPGVTRDRLYATTEWLDREFVIIDTGGIEIANTDKIAVSIREQAQIAIREADVILFVLGEPIPISAANHLGLGDMLDSVMDKVQQTVPQLNEEDEDEIKVALIGRPNVGKSSIFNALVGEERSIVSDQAGTTRDAIDTPVVKEGQRFLFIDTAGMRRKGKIEELIEKYSIVRSLRAVDRSDVVLMVIDAVEGVTEQDKKIVGYAHEAGKGVILVVNKWDLYKKDTGSTLRYTEELRKELVFLQYAPVVFVSAVTMQRIHRLPEVIKYVAEQNAMRISTSVINQIIEDACAINPPPTDKGRQLKIYFVTQVKIKPPTFVLFVNNPEIMHFSYQRYLENKLREAFGFEGTPIQMIIRAKNEEDL